MTAPEPRWGEPAETAPAVSRTAPQPSVDLGAGVVIRAAWHSVRQSWRRILLAAACIFGALALTETLILAFVPEGGVLGTVLDVVEGAEGIVALLFFTSLLVALVGWSEHDRPKATIRSIARSIPYGKLVIVALLVGVILVLGFLALVVPSLILFTLLALAGPILEIEHTTSVGSLRRSSQLVHPHFWLVGALVTLPFVVGVAGVSVAIDVSQHFHLVLVFLISAVGNALVEVVTGLLAVELAYRLPERARERRRLETSGPAA